MLHPNQPTVSSYCSADKPQCAEATLVHTNADRPRWYRALFGTSPIVELRDTKTPERQPVRFTPAEWRYFCATIRGWRPAADGLYRIGDLAFTRAEAAAFRAGVDAGEFVLHRGRVTA